MHRIQGVKMIRNGYSPTDVAALFQVSVRSVFKWVALFNAGGQNALLAKTVPGRPPKVSPEQLQWISLTVRDNAPNQLKFEFGLWTLRLIGELIERQFQLKLSLPTLSKVMAQLGFTVQRPLYRAYQQDAVLVERWKTQELPALQQRAQARGAVLLYADEAGLRSDYHAGTTWGLRGRTPVVSSTGRRQSVNMISAISAEGHLQFLLTKERVNGSVFKHFLEQLMLGATRPILLVVDGHPIHKSKLVRDYVDATQGRLELYFLPPYSPQLNPDEQVWKNVKERVAKQMICNVHEMQPLARAARLQALPEIIRGFFRHPKCGFYK
ncbi:MAG: IS630 family transposase [Candidatus Accumulibacter sp.]|nr:IS630 family transposase [Accumulibacter sp.]